MTKPSLSIFFPAYNDAGTIASLVLVAHMTARKLTDDYEVIVVDDGSPDHTGELLDEMARGLPWLRVVHHEKNRGYGGALRTGFLTASKELVFYTDGDAQYDPRELVRLYEVFGPEVDFVNGYKIGRSDPLHRIVIGRVYHWFVKLAFGLRLRDVDCDFRLMRRSVFDKVVLTRSSGVICVELMKKVQDHGFRLAEVPRAPLPPHLRQEPVLQLPAGGADASRPRPPVARARGAQGAPQVACRSAPSRRSRRALEPAPGMDYQDSYRGRKVLVTGGLGFIGSNLCRTLADLGAQVLAVDSLLAGLRRQPLQPRRLRGQGPHQHRRRARARDGVPGQGPGGALQPGRAGEPHRLHGRSLHRPRDQRPQPALDPGGGAQGQSRAQDRVRGHAPGLRQAPVPARRREPTC